MNRRYYRRTPVMNRRSYYRWTPKDDWIIIQGSAEGLTSKQLARLLPDDRSEVAIRMRLKRLRANGVAAPSVIYRRYSEEDIEYIKKAYPDLLTSVAEIAERLGRNAQSIRQTARLMGLRRGQNGNE